MANDDTVFEPDALNEVRVRLAGIMGVEPGKVDVSVDDQLVCIDAIDAFRLVLAYELTTAQLDRERVRAAARITVEGNGL